MERIYITNGEINKEHKIFVYKPQGKRLSERHRSKWDNIKIDLRDLRVLENTGWE